MRAGALRHQLTFESPAAATQNAYGEKLSGTWTEQGTVWGAVSPLAGRELEHARQTHATVTHRIVVRYHATLAFTPTWRVKFGSRYFGIESVLKTGEINHEIVMLATEIVA